MTTLPTSNNLKGGGNTNDCKSKPPHLVHAPRLQVPTISVTDKTPTPTKLLRAADEIGLFQDVEFSSEIAAQKGKKIIDFFKQDILRYFTLGLVFLNHYINQYVSNFKMYLI